MAHKMGSWELDYVLFCNGMNRPFIISFAIGVLILAEPVTSSAQCLNDPLAFQHGERIKYEVAYNWGMVWVDAGEVIFRVDTLTRNGVKMFRFDSYGESYKFYDWIFRVRDHFQALVEMEDFKPVWFNRDTHEGGYFVDNTYAYDWAAGKVISTRENSNQALIIDTLAIEPCTFDVLAAIYYARNLDFEDYDTGDKIPIRFLIDGEFFELYIRYLGKENKKTRSGAAYPCFKFSAMLVEGTIFSEGEDMVVWVTADENRVPVMVEAKILIGSIKAYLTGYENLVSELKPVK
jgi:hypothetical protein